MKKIQVPVASVSFDIKATPEEVAEWLEKQVSQHFDLVRTEHGDGSISIGMVPKPGVLAAAHAHPSDWWARTVPLQE